MFDPITTAGLAGFAAFAGTLAGHAFGQPRRRRRPVKVVVRLVKARRRKARAAK